MALSANASPAFLLGAVGRGVFHSETMGFFLIGCQLLALLITGLILRFVFPKKMRQIPEEMTASSFSFVGSVISAGKSLRGDLLFRHNFLRVLRGFWRMAWKKSSFGIVGGLGRMRSNRGIWLFSGAVLVLPLSFLRRSLRFYPARRLFIWQRRYLPSVLFGEKSLFPLLLRGASGGNRAVSQNGGKLSFHVRRLHPYGGRPFSACGNLADSPLPDALD